MLSIAICTYNRSESLSVLLNQLSEQHEWLASNAEIIVVDNNSSDDTIDVLKKYQTLLPLCVFTETEQGLAAARNRAIGEYKGNALLFFDDDVSINLQTLESYKELLELKPSFDFFGGKIVVDWQGKRPRWLQSNDLVLLNGLFGSYDLGHEGLAYKGGIQLPFGANFMLRRSLIDKVGLFNTRLGVIGAGIGRGEETDYFRRAQRMGFNGFYSGLASVGHRFQKERINIPYLLRYGVEKGRAIVLVDQVQRNFSAINMVVAMANFAIRGLYQVVKGRRDRFYQCVINIGIQRGLWRESRLNRGEH